MMSFLTWYNSFLWSCLVRIPDYAKYDFKFEPSRGKTNNVVSE